MDALRDSSSTTAQPHNDGPTRTPGEDGKPPVRERVIAFFTRHRRVVAIGVALCMLLLEIGEHIFILVMGDTAHRLFDLGIYIILMPAFTLLLLGALEQAERDLVMAKRSRGLQDELSQKLGKASSRQSLVQGILEYTHDALPGVTATLYSYDLRDLGLRSEGLCAPNGSVVLSSCEEGKVTSSSAAPLSMQLGGDNATGHSHTSADPCARYDLPLTRNGQKVGLLQLEFAATAIPAAAEMRAMKSALPLIALALDGALLQDLAASQAAASQQERQIIAQNLHDSLAQNISYLRLKLDQLTGENAIHEIGVVLQELERMRASADEAYQQVRSTLDELAAPGSEDLSTILESHARAISERSGFALHTNRSGAAFPLPASTRQHILYITREALHNIEKHARAKIVNLQLLWLEQGLVLKITDDGVGFDPLIIGESGHYGLWIMQQRAQELGGSLKISPSDERGTEVTLWVPYPLL